MTLSRGMAIYAVAGAVLVGTLYLVDGSRGIGAALAAWALCLPLLLLSFFGRVAEPLSVHKKTTHQRGIKYATWGMPIRFAWALGGAALVNQWTDGALGSGFLLAVVPCYLVALFVSVARANRPSGASIHDGAVHRHDFG